MPDKNKPASGFQYSLTNLKPVEPEVKVALTFPDGARREFPKSITGLDIAKGISPSLAKRTVAMALDGVVTDLGDPIEHDAKIEFIARDDARALELIRHDAAHVLAEAVQALWPGTQVTIGPVIENGFYYDFFRNEPFTPEDFAAIEKKMREIIARDKPFTKDVWDREKTKQVFRDKGEAFKVELVDAIPGDEPIKIYYQGDWFDLCRGPHMTSTGKIGNAFKLMKVAGAYWRGDSNNPMLTRIYGTAFAKQEELDAYLKQIEEAEKRDHRKLGRELDLFHFQEEGPGVVFWHAKGWTIFQALIAYMRRRLTGDYSEVNAPQILDKSLWETSGHWDWYRENMFAAQSAGDEAEDKRWFALKPMNCPGHVQIFKHGLKSYRDLPLRLAEFGVVHRYEPSGAMHGLMRVRGFTQDDAHVFCTEAQLADECLTINDLIMSTYADFGFVGELTIKLSTRPEKRVGTDEMWDHAERVMATVLQEIEAQGPQPKHQDRDQSRRRRVLRPEIRIRAARRHRPRLAMRHHAGRLQSAGAFRRVLHRCRRFEEDPGHGASRDLRLDGALHRHPDRALCRQFSALAGAESRPSSPPSPPKATNTPRWSQPRRGAPACASRSTCATRRSTTRSANIRWQRSRRCWWSARRKPRTHSVSIRRLGSEGQTVMPTDEAIAALVDEATPPDVKRARLGPDGPGIGHRRTGIAGLSDPGLPVDPGSEPADGGGAGDRNRPGTQPVSGEPGDSGRSRQGSVGAGGEDAAQAGSDLAPAVALHPP